MDDEARTVMTAEIHTLEDMEKFIQQASQIGKTPDVICADNPFQLSIVAKILSDGSVVHDVVVDDMTDTERHQRVSMAVCLAATA